MGTNPNNEKVPYEEKPFLQHGAPQPVAPPVQGYAPPQAGYAPQQGYPPPQGVLYTPGAPITNQPMGQGGVPQIQWMEKPQNVLNCPPGLEYLSMVDQLLIQQQVDFLEVLSNFEMENKYIILNTLGQQVYFAQEVSDTCNRNCYGSSRDFEMKITDNFGNLIINMKRPCACACCCCPCCLNSMEISAPPGTLVGTIEQQWSLLYPKFVIKNPHGDIVLRISGPCCTAACCADVEFQLLSADGNTQVGKIRKQWGGYAKESYTNADNFGITFPMDLDVGMKAVMLGACFLIDFMYYEQRPKQNRDQQRHNTGRVGMHNRH